MFGLTITNKLQLHPPSIFMFSLAVKKRIGQQVDRLVLYMLNSGIPNAFEQSDLSGPALQEIVDQTRVKRRKTALYNLVAPGEHEIWLDTPLGEMRCLVKVRLAVMPDAPLLLYHHGLVEIPYTSTWERLLPKSSPFPAHSAAVQAPYHNSISEPLVTGFSSIQHIYQMFAGSLRVYELMQEQFEADGAAFTVTGGLSWGGITSLLYEALFQRARATIPMFASPNLAQVLADGAALIGRPLPLPREKLDATFDFTPAYEQCAKNRIFPVLGEDDLFFRFERHAVVYSQETLLAVPSTHVGAMWRARRQIQRHVLEILDWAERHPR
jgi:hypothetical protein